MHTIEQDPSELEAGTTAKAANEYLSFRLGAEEYGIDILKVQEIRGYEKSTRMVSAPRDVLGVLNLRGVIVPIVDMRLRFGLDEVPYNDQTVTIVLNLQRQVIGMVVDGVSDVVALKNSDIKPAPAMASAVDTQHIVGIASITQAERDRMLILLDIEGMLAGLGEA